MTASADIEALLRELVSQQGLEQAERTLKSALEDARDAVLTIIPNVGIHRIPDRYLRGTVFVGSEGNLDFSSKRSIETEYKGILLQLKQKLLSQPWNKIYLIPTGHVTLSMQMKLLVYQLTRINTIDLFYLNGKYFELRFDARQLEASSGKSVLRSLRTGPTGISVSPSHKEMSRQGSLSQRRRYSRSS